jgi:hypothetical protein
MTISEKKIELIQQLLLLQDKIVLFEIEKLINSVSQLNKTNKPSKIRDEKVPNSYEEWVSQFEDIENGEIEDEYGYTTSQFRKKIWKSEQSEEMSLDEFYVKLAKI